MGVVIPQVVSEDRASGAQVIEGSLKFNGDTSAQYMFNLSGGAHSSSDFPSKKTIKVMTWKLTINFGTKIMKKK